MNITDMLNEGLKSMKLPKEETKKMDTCCPTPGTPEGDRYPYGLEIRLDEKVLKLCGKEANDFDINQTCMIVAECEVVQIRSSAGKKEYQNNESVELQITSMKFQKKEMKEHNSHMGSHNSDTKDSY